MVEKSTYVQRAVAQDAGGVNVVVRGGKEVPSSLYAILEDVQSTTLGLKNTRLWISEH